MSVKPYSRLQPALQLKAAKLLQYSAASLGDIVKALDSHNPVFVLRKDGRLLPCDESEIKAIHNHLQTQHKGQA